MPTFEIRIIGYVQGVGFRGYVKQSALVQGICGEAWNTRDLAVQIIAQHEDENVLKRFEEEMWRGPGRVDAVHVKAIHSKNYAAFEIKETR